MGAVPFLSAGTLTFPAKRNATAGVPYYHLVRCRRTSPADAPNSTIIIGEERAAPYCVSINSPQVAAAA
jgi:hypothetical protein